MQECGECVQPIKKCCDITAVLNRCSTEKTPYFEGGEEDENECISIPIQGYQFDSTEIKNCVKVLLIESDRKHCNFDLFQRTKSVLYKVKLLLPKNAMNIKILLMWVKQARKMFRTNNHIIRSNKVLYWDFRSRSIFKCTIRILLLLICFIFYFRNRYIWLSSYFTIGVSYTVSMIKKRKTLSR